MTGRRIEAADVRRVAIGADERAVLVDCRQFFADVLSQALFVMTLGARSDRHVRL